MIKIKYIFLFLFAILLRSVDAQVKPLNLLSDTMVICAGDSFLLKFSDDQVNKTATYTWQTPRSIIVHTKQIYLKYKGIHIVKINDGKKQLVDTTFVKLNEKPRLKLRDTVLCGAPLILSVKNKSYTYLWNTGEISEQIKIEKPGTYWIRANNKGCFFTDTFKVILANAAVPNFPKEIMICENEVGKVLSVKAPPDVKLFWNTGANSSSINANKEGIYWVKSISKNCGIKTDSVTIKYKNCDCDIFIPNSFTPNDDDKNDMFSPVFQCDYNYFQFTVMDRWGNTVYTSNNINGKWDGKFKGNPCPDDVYVYRLDAIQKGTEKKISRNGHISLFR
ncbi:MAG: gliding motility-associated C-terminal domain-containing protein [Bacteroidota bacterium]